VLAAPTSDNGGYTWVWVFVDGGAVNPFVHSSGSLVDGIYTADVDPTKVNALAGGTAMAAAASLTFHRLFGDVDGNKAVNNADFGLFRNSFGKSSGDAGFNRAFDFDNNGVVNNADFGQFRNRFLKMFTYV
jgi:hypothetical protein